MKKKLYLTLCLAMLATWGFAQSIGDYYRLFIEGEPIKVGLWEQGAPNSNGIGEDVDASDPLVSIFSSMVGLNVYLPPKSDKPTKAVIICPGGAYIALATHYEGMLWRNVFMQENIAVIVLFYRMPYGHHEVPASDVYETMRIIKAHAEEWNIDPDGIGVMGSSAGGHLASTAATHATDDVRPAFQILFYPVISMDDRYTHAGSKENLLGKNPTDELVKLYSNELQVTPQTPKALLLLTDDDDVVNPMNSVLYYQALKANNVPASMYIYPTGGHVFGTQDSFLYHDEMILNLRSWLRALD